MHMLPQFPGESLTPLLETFLLLVLAVVILIHLTILTMEMLLTDSHKLGVAEKAIKGLGTMRHLGGVGGTIWLIILTMEILRVESGQPLAVVKAIPPAAIIH